MSIIGITCGSNTEKTQDYQLRRYYLTALQKHGDSLLILPPQTSKQFNDYLPLLDGILFSGGGDIHSSFWQEEPAQKIGRVDWERDQFEITLARTAFAINMPMLGICRGMQVLNVAAGGSIYQDLQDYERTKKRKMLQHQQCAAKDQVWHQVHILHKKLHEILGERICWVNSFHHQCCCRLGNGFALAAITADGVPEAIWRESSDFVLGVQWHPERLWQDWPAQNKIFAAFVQAAANYHQKKK